MRRSLHVRGLPLILAPFALALTLAACTSALPHAVAPIEEPIDELIEELIDEPIADPPELTGAFTLSPPTPIAGAEVTFHARDVTCRAAPCTFLWEDVNGGAWRLGEGEVLTFTFQGPGVKRVQLTVTDANGDVATHVTDVAVLASDRTPVPRPELPSSADDALTWAPPAGYEHFRVVNVPVRGGIGSLDNTTDYLLVMPPTARRQPLTIDGGRHVVVIGGEIDVEDARTGPESAFRGIIVRGGSVDGRIVHLEGLKIHSSGGTISDGINTNAGGSRFVLQVQNVRIGPLPRSYVVGSRNHHPDVIQTWGSVGELRIDRLTGITAYQGLFFKADYNGPHGDVDVRRTNLRGLAGGAYLLWLSDKGGRWPGLSLHDVWLQPAPGRDLGKTIWPDSGSSSHAPSLASGTATWSSLPVTGVVRMGTPPGGDFVPEGSVGIGYRSPGYR